MANNDLGQISGFTTMDDFKMRFAQYDPSTGEHSFSNVRKGLIVGLVRSTRGYLELS